MVIGQPEQDEIIYLYEGKKFSKNFLEDFGDIKQFKSRIEKLIQEMKRAAPVSATAKISLDDDGNLHQGGFFGWISLGKRPNSKTVLLVPDFLRTAIEC